MRTVILDRGDFAGNGVMDFDDMLDSLGVENPGGVINRVTLYVTEVEIED